MATQEARQLVAIVRVSAPRGRGGDSFISTELQLDGIRSWVDTHDEYRLPDDLVFEELDVSGARPLARRPSLRRAVELVESGEAAGIIGVRLNRIARSPEVYGEVKRRVLAGGGVVIGVDEGGVRTDEPEVDLQDDVTQSFAKYEVGRARKVFQLARARAVRRGVATFPAPAGYDRLAVQDDPRGPVGRLVPNEDAPMISEAFRMRAAGDSVNAIAEALTRARVQARPGKKGSFTTGWSRSGVAHLLRNRVYLGELSADHVVNPNAHEPLIDAAMFHAAQRPVKARPVRESRHPFLLTKVTRCAGCGAAMVGVMAHPHGREKPAHALYRCQTRGCPAHASIGARKLEAYVENRLLAYLSTMPVDAAIDVNDQSELAVLEARRDELQREVDAWRSMPVADIDPAFYAQGLSDRLAPLDETLTEIGRLRASQNRQPGHVLTATVPDDWQDLDLPERREIVRAAIESVTVLKAAATVALEQRVRVALADPR
jgi:DNA invertase Pin-like site-specific DNA recombinase